jgi:hypothetical protein
MNGDHGFDERFAAALAAAPEIPDCFDGIMRRIKRENAGKWTIRTIAALFVMSLVSFVFIDHRVHEPVTPEVVEELQGIHNLVSGEDIREELVSSSLTGEDTF